VVFLILMTLSFSVGKMYKVFDDKCMWFFLDLRSPTW